MFLKALVFVDYVLCSFDIYQKKKYFNSGDTNAYPALSYQNDQSTGDIKVIGGDDLSTLTGKVWHIICLKQPLPPQKKNPKKTKKNNNKPKITNHTEETNNQSFRKEEKKKKKTNVSFKIFTIVEWWGA